MQPADKGFSIVEVLVAAGVLSIVALGITSVVTGTIKQQKGVQAKDQQREVTAIIRNILKESRACEFSFINRTITTAPSATDSFLVTEIRDDTLPAGIPRLRTTETDQTGLLRYEEFRVSNLVVSPTSETVTLNVKLSKVGSDVGVKDLKIDPITLRVTRNVAGVITSCNSLGAAGSPSFWSQSANGSDIYFNTGSIGIGTTTPVVKLHVQNGEFALGSMDSVFDAGPFPAYGNRMYINGVASQNTDPLLLQTVFNASDSSELRVSIGDNVGGEDQFSVGNYTGIGSTWVPWLSVVNNGNVGVGTATPGTKLDVSGVIRSNNEITSTMAGGFGQFRAIAGAYGTMLRNDSVDTYLLITNPGDQYGVWNGLRPFSINNGSGNVRLGGNAVFAQHSGNVGIGNDNPQAKLHVTGTILPAAQNPGWGCSPMGAQGYHPGTGAPLYCANTGVWTAVGGGGSGGACVSATQTNSGQNNYCPGGYYMRDIVFPRGNQDNASAQWAQITCCPL